jgi:hypothetical protein
MKLLLGKRGLVDLIGPDGNSISLGSLHLVYDEDAHTLRVQNTAAGQLDVPVWTIDIPRVWTLGVFARAFGSDGGPITLQDVLDDSSERGAIAREEKTDPGEAAFEAFSLSVSRRSTLARAAAKIFSEKLRTRLPELLERLVEESVHEVRDAEETIAGVRLPWGGPIAPKRRRGGQPGNTLEHYVNLRARQLQTGKSLQSLFAESRSESRQKTRYYDGRRAYSYLKRHR